jgi:hypothetical protein
MFDIISQLLFVIQYGMAGWDIELHTPTITNNISTLKLLLIYLLAEIITSLNP